LGAWCSRNQSTSTPSKQLRRKPKAPKLSLNGAPGVTGGVCTGGGPRCGCLGQLGPISALLVQPQPRQVLWQGSRRRQGGSNNLFVLLQVVHSGDLGPSSLLGPLKGENNL